MKKIFRKITSQLHEVIKRILIVLSVILFLSIMIFYMGEGMWDHEGKMIGRTFIWLLIEFCFFIAYWIIVAVINWIVKGANK